MVNVGLTTGSIFAVDLRDLATLFKHFNVNGTIDYTKELKDNLGAILNLDGSSPSLNSPGGEAGFGIRDAASIALGFTPAGDVLAVVGAITGYDPVSGRQLEPLDRWLGLLGLIALGGEAVAFAKGLRGAERVAQAARTERAVDRASDVVRAIKDCANSFSAKTKVWVSQEFRFLSKASSALTRIKSMPFNLVLKAQKTAKAGLMAIAISSVVIGTPVLAFNESSKTERVQEVITTIHHIDQEIVKLTLETGEGKIETLQTTKEHPFYVLTEARANANGVWVDAGKLERGNWLKRAHGKYGVVKWVQLEAKTQEMYNLTVARDHTFFVGDGQWLVHNSSGCSISDGLFRRLENLEGVLKDVEGHLDAGRRELNGEIVAVKPNGVPYDHVQEIRDAQRGAQNVIIAAKRALENGIITLKQFQQLIARASAALDHAKKYVPPR